MDLQGRRKVKYVLIVTAILIIENITLWYSAIFYYQYRKQEEIAESRLGQSEICKNIPASDDLFSVLKAMRKYSSNIYLNSSETISLNYGSEASRDFAVGAGVGFEFDKDYKLIHKSCEGFVE